MCEVKDLKAKLAAATRVIKNLEGANDALCAARSQSLYLQMIQEGQEDLLTNLDYARRDARQFLQEQEK